MPRKIQVTDEQVAWLKEAIANKTTWQAMADHIGCCVDTLKRILVRKGIAEFDGAKYVLPLESNVKMWTRPCSVCKCTAPRPKWQYRCDACHQREKLDSYEYVTA